MICECETEKKTVSAVKMSVLVRHAGLVTIQAEVFASSFATVCVSTLLVCRGFLKCALLKDTGRRKLQNHNWTKWI